jgi:hypothetical protein
LWKAQHQSVDRDYIQLRVIGDKDHEAGIVDFPAIA